MLHRIYAKNLMRCPWDTVRGYLSEEGAQALLAHLRAITQRIGVSGGNGTDPELKKWRLDPKRGWVSSLLLFDLGDPASALNPLSIGIDFHPPPGSVTEDVPEEHTQLIIQDGQVWTFGDLAFTDPHRFFYGIDFHLGSDARDRMHAKLLATDPATFWSRPIWPSQTSASEACKPASQRAAPSMNLQGAVPETLHNQHPRAC